MKKYRVNVNGNAYEVEIELIDEKEVANKEVAPKAEAATAAPAAPAPAPQTQAGEGKSVAAPMPGTILAVNVTTGKAVKKGDVLFILEAMKMENEIMADCDGTITSVTVSKGAAVEAGAVLCTIA